MNFNKDIVDILGNIEEKRLVFGAKLVKFYQNKLKIAADFWQKNCAQKYGFLYINLIIVAVSVYLRSTADIGFESAFNIKLTRDFIDFGKISPSVSFANYLIVFGLLPVFYLGDLLGFLNFILLDFYLNLLAVSALFFIYKTLSADNSHVKNYAKIILVTFSVAFFWRPNILVYNDFITSQSITLLLIFWLTAILMAKNKNLSVAEFLVIKLLALIILIFNPQSLVLIIALSSGFFIDGSKQVKVLVAVFAIILFGIFWRYFWIDWHNIEIYKNLTQWQKNMLVFIVPLLINPQLYKIDRQIKLLRILAFYSVWWIIVAGMENVANRAFYFALSLPYVVFVLKNILRNKQYSYNWFVVISLMIFAFFAVDLPEILAGLILLILPIILIYREFFFTKYNNNNSYKRQSIVIVASVLLFYGFWFYVGEIWQILYLALSLLICYVILNAKTSERNYSYQVNLVILLIIFMFMGNYFRSIFHDYFRSEITEINNLQSPNNFSDNIHKIYSQFNLKNSENLILSPFFNHLYPLKIDHDWREEKIENSLQIIRQFQNYLSIANISKNIDHDFFYALISNNSNRLIVIYNDNYINSKSCNIGILEELLTDVRIKEYFKLNYNFLTQIFDIEESNFFVPNYTQENLSDDEFEVLKNIDLKQPKYLKHNVFEIYIRK